MQEVPFKDGCLNPCFSGTYSRRLQGCSFRRFSSSLNPCFSGTYSRRSHEPLRIKGRAVVLILVLVEHTLGAACSTSS